MHETDIQQLVDSGLSLEVPRIGSNRNRLSVTVECNRNRPQFITGTGRFP